MENQFIVASSPHIAGKRTTWNIMLDVIIACMFPAIASVIIFGYRAAILISVCVVSCVVFEALWCVLLKKPMAIRDLSAVVTGMLLAFNLPSGLPIWQAVFGCFVAIVVVKQLFGGIGCNFANPAIAARIVMALSFAKAMSTYGAPMGGAVASSTPLKLVGLGFIASIDMTKLFFGNYAGVLGETSTLALLIGGIYLCARKVIKPIIPVAFIGSTFVFCWLFGSPAPLITILSGGLFLGAIYMATDYTTSPYTDLGKLIFGIGCGLLTAIIRIFANMTEGVSFAILIMNLLVPFINEISRRKPFGYVKDPKQPKGGANNG